VRRRRRLRALQAVAIAVYTQDSDFDQLSVDVVRV
jgi:hypothetical protein